jgi:hypothetical protein
MSESNSNVPIFGYLFIQCAMLFLSYGLKYNMPQWVVWFPSLIVGSIVLIVIIVVLIILIISVLR